MKHTISFVLLAGMGALLLPANARAQTATVTGVVQTTDALPISGATVRLAGTAFGTLTDASGRFRIHGIAAGDYTVIAEQIGFLSREEVITLRDSVGLRFVLNESPVALSGVVVTATGAAERHMSATTAIGAVTGPELRASPAPG
jgi:hypothetical protein